MAGRSAPAGAAAAMASKDEPPLPCSGGRGAALYLPLAAEQWDGEGRSRAAAAASASSCRAARHLCALSAGLALLAAPAILLRGGAAPTSGVLRAGLARAAELVAVEDAGRAVEVFLTAKGTNDRLTAKPRLSLERDFHCRGPVIDINASWVDQELVGFGGAFTEAAATTFARLPETLQDIFVEQYFGSTGLGYSLGRIHINSCDFSSGGYSFDDVQDDFALKQFNRNLTRDREAIIPLLLRAKEKVESIHGRKLRLLASPWSPPWWMKTSLKMDGSGSPCLKQGATQTWADYISTWVSAYKEAGLPVWGLTVQNEPTNNAVWEACTFTPTEEAAFLGGFLGPTMRRDHPEVSIFVFDDSKHMLHEYVDLLKNHKDAGKYVDGAAFHWYSGDWFDKVLEIHRQFPEVMLLPSEATYERRMWKPGNEEPYPDWRFGEGYAHDIIGDLNAGAVGWIDWNLLLDRTGGPNHVGNVCEAAVVADVEGQVLTVHPQYYFVGHFSKFLPPGSRRIAADVDSPGGRLYKASQPPGPYGTCTGESGLEATAFKRPDKRLAVVVLNCAQEHIQFKLRLRGHHLAVRADAPPRSIATYLLPDLAA